MMAAYSSLSDASPLIPTAPGREVSATVDCNTRSGGPGAALHERGWQMAQKQQDADILTQP